MKKQTLSRIRCAGYALLLSTLNPQLSTFAQGGLAPPSAPAPTMKTLAQIEPRTPISSAPFVITNGGSYCLTTNLTVNNGDAITIATDGVTLDLNGFTIASTAAGPNGYGIRFSGYLCDLTIFNGHIRSGATNDGNGNYGGTGFAYGISGFYPTNAHVSGVSVSGCLTHGILLGKSRTTMVESCTVQTVSGWGIYASTVKSSVAVECGSGIIGDVVSDCRGQALSGPGLQAYETALNCSGYTTGVGQTGLQAVIAIGCYGNSPAGIGLSATIANSCRIGAGTTNITYKYNMP